MLGRYYHATVTPAAFLAWVDREQAWMKRFGREEEGRVENSRGRIYLLNQRLATCVAMLVHCVHLHYNSWLSLSIRPPLCPPQARHQASQKQPHSATLQHQPDSARPPHLRPRTGNTLLDLRAPPSLSPVGL